MHCSACLFLRVLIHTHSEQAYSEPYPSEGTLPCVADEWIEPWMVHDGRVAKVFHSHHVTR